MTGWMANKFRSWFGATEVTKLEKGNDLLSREIYGEINCGYSVILGVDHPVLSSPGYT